jgi:hypothetical protein
MEHRKILNDRFSAHGLFPVHITSIKAKIINMSVTKIPTFINILYVILMVGSGRH